MLLLSGNVHSCSSGKEAVLVVLAACIQQLFCTANALVVGCREKKRNGAMLWILARIGVAITLEVTQWVSGRVQRRKTCSLIECWRRKPLDITPLLEGNGTACASISCSTRCIGDKLIVVFRSVGEW